jgi:HlyD family secretion protein
MSYFESAEKQSRAQVSQAEADLRAVEGQTASEIRQAEANLAAARSQAAQAEADQEIAQLDFTRTGELYRSASTSQQAYDEARTAFAGATAKLEAAREQVRSAQAAVAVAEANAEEVAARKAALAAGIQQLAGAGAQRDKAEVRLGYTEIRAPIDGVVDVRAALAGEVVNPGQAIVTLVDPDDLWVRADVEESYIDRIRLGDKLTVRLPSGAEREGVVFFRGVDADYATQRDVSRTKRDIKTFEVRLRCDNRDRTLAVGMTAFVVVPLGRR